MFVVLFSSSPVPSVVRSTILVSFSLWFSSPLVLVHRIRCVCTNARVAWRVCFERGRKVIAAVENSSAKTTDLSSPRFRIWKRFVIDARNFLIGESITRPQFSRERRRQSILDREIPACARGHSPFDRMLNATRSYNLQTSNFPEKLSSEIICLFGGSLHLEHIVHVASFIDICTRQ